MKEETRLAIALQYTAGEDEAPSVIASGRGLLAERMVAQASQSKIPVHQDQHLAAVLAKLETGTEIPPELYQAVAQVLVFIWKLDQPHATREEQSHES